MNDFGLTEKIIENISDFQHLNENFESVKSFVITFIIFATLNIISIIVNLVMQFKLKNKDKEIIKFNLRESERIKILFRLYELLEQLTYYCEEDRETYIEKANQINQFITKNKLYIDKSYINIAQEMNDYFLTVIGDYRKKDYKNEMRLLDEYTKQFNK